MSRLLALTLLFLTSIPAYSMPQFLEMYRRDPFRNPSVDGCITCHMSAQGGDARNAFGQAFESGGEQITPMLRAQFPDRFVYPVSRTAALTIHFSDPSKKQVVVESAGAKSLVDVDQPSVNGSPATNTTSPTRVVTSDSQVNQRAESVPVDQYAREGAFFGSNIVNLPDGKPQKKGGVDFFVGHRFAQDVSGAGLGGLFGFDSGANIAFGVRVGVTNRISVSALRSNLNKTISLGAALQVSRQSPEVPVTLQVRLGVDGSHNFGLFKTDIATNKNLLFVNGQLVPEQRQYSPYLQVVMTRTFKDRLSFSAVPMVTVNTREQQRVDPTLALGGDHENTFSLGIGLGYRFLPTTSIVGEYIPRLSGFKSELKSIPAIHKDPERLSVGLQKSTFRHTFELVVSRQPAMTPALYSYQGKDTFQLGFNIYRKLK
jgi:hypothetical protein